MCLSLVEESLQRSRKVTSWTQKTVNMIDPAAHLLHAGLKNGISQSVSALHFFHFNSGKVSAHVKVQNI